MSIVFILLPVSGLLAATALVAFVWSVRKGQMDDLDTPAVRILHDDEEARSGASSGPRGECYYGPTKR